jgi:hypothetical protein
LLYQSRRDDHLLIVKVDDNILFYLLFLSK